MDVEQVPLPALLGNARRAFAEDFDARLAGSEFSDISMAHARNVLRPLTGGPLRASQMHVDCNVTKQALSQQISTLERLGYIATLPDPDDHRARLISLTDKGQRAHALIRRLFDEIEQSWVAKIGRDDVTTLRRILTELSE